MKVKNILLKIFLIYHHLSQNHMCLKKYNITLILHPQALNKYPIVVKNVNKYVYFTVTKILFQTERYNCR